jgi:hypothetical protein
MGCVGQTLDGFGSAGLMGAVAVPTAAAAATMK